MNFFRQNLTAETSPLGKTITRGSRKKLHQLFDAEHDQLFVSYCLQLLRSGYSLFDFFTGSGELYSSSLEHGLALHTKAQAGTVYLMTNPIYGNAIYKIGKTRKTAQARQISLRTAGVLGEFTLVAQWESLDLDRTERRCHARFLPYKIQREFFNLSYAPLIAGIDAVLHEEAEALMRLRQLGTQIH